MAGFNYVLELGVVPSGGLGALVVDLTGRAYLTGSAAGGPGWAPLPDQGGLAIADSKAIAAALLPMAADAPAEGLAWLAAPDAAGALIATAALKSDLVVIPYSADGTRRVGPATHVDAAKIRPAHALALVRL
jgi:hypothetical protein